MVACSVWLDLAMEHGTNPTFSRPSSAVGVAGRCGGSSHDHQTNLSLRDPEQRVGDRWVGRGVGHKPLAARGCEEDRLYFEVSVFTVTAPKGEPMCRHPWEATVHERVRCSRSQRPAVNPLCWGCDPFHSQFHPGTLRPTTSHILHTPHRTADSPPSTVLEARPTHLFLLVPGATTAYRTTTLRQSLGLPWRRPPALNGH